MTRILLALGVTFVAAVIAGCSLDRAPLRSRPDDGGGADGGEPDAGPRCLSDADCDDGQPCTDDRCVPTAGCLHDENTAPCDDGVLCNGADTCRARGCREHDFVDPCPGMSTCDTASDSCMGCVSDADCPGETTGDWGACTFPAGDLCTTAGTRARTITAYTCVASVCEERPRTESEACTRTTDGAPCGTRVGGMWSACVYADPTCSTTGTRSRTVTVPACAGGTCVSGTTTETDTAGCARTTAGTSCADPIVTDWSACAGFADTCDESGTRSRSTTTFECGASGTCDATIATEDAACTRSTDGAACGTVACDPYGPCMPTAMGTCSSSGTQSRTCQSESCAGGTCSGTGMSTVETRACTITVGGSPCTTMVACGPCHEPGDTRCRSGRTGERNCTTGSGTCTMGGTCIPSTTTETCMCP